MTTIIFIVSSLTLRIPSRPLWSAYGNNPDYSSFEKPSPSSDREVSLEERGMEANRFNAVFGAWLGARSFPSRSLQKFSLLAAPRQRPIASLWRARLSIALARE